MEVRKMKRIWIDVDDAVDFEDALGVLHSVNIDKEFISGMGVEVYENE